MAALKLNNCMTTSSSLVLVLLALWATPLAVVAGDSDILTDYIIPATTNAANITGAFFTYSGLRGAGLAGPGELHGGQGLHGGVPGAQIFLLEVPQ